MAKIYVIVGVRFNALLVRTSYPGCVLLVRTPYLSFRDLPYSSGPYILTSPTRQDLIFYVPKFNLLVRTPYILVLSARQDPIFLPPARQDPICCPEAGPGNVNLFLARTVLEVTGFCGKEFHPAISLFDFFNKCHSRQ